MAWFFVDGDRMRFEQIAGLDIDGDALVPVSQVKLALYLHAKKPEGSWEVFEKDRWYKCETCQNEANYEPDEYEVIRFCKYCGSDNGYLNQPKEDEESNEIDYPDRRTDYEEDW